jgi:hypothetical protein
VNNRGGKKREVLSEFAVRVFGAVLVKINYQQLNQSNNAKMIVTGEQRGDTPASSCRVGLAASEIVKE